MTFWERFYNLCLENKTKPNPVCKKLGFSNSASTHWKAGQLPGATSLKKIANYFNVSTDYLLGKTDIKKEPTTQSEQSVSEDLQKLIDASFSLSDEEAQKALAFVEFLKSQRN